MTKLVSSTARLTLLAAVLHATVVRESVAGEIPIQPVQSALKKQGFYEGEPSGRLDPPTRGALKRFQIHQGLAATGEIDKATVEALKGAGKASSAVAALEPSIRERAQEVVRSDQDFLEKVESLEASEVAPAATPPPVKTPVAKPAPPVGRSAPRPARTPATAPAPPPPVGSAPESVVVAPERSEPSPALQADEVQSFVDEYLRAAQAPTPDKEVAFYADDVDYFDSGRVSRTFVEKDQRAYYRRWPSRKFTLTGEPTIERVSDRGATVRFRMRYALRSDSDSASGRTENVLRVKRTENGLRIAGIRERKLTE